MPKQVRHDEAKRWSTIAGTTLALLTATPALADAATDFRTGNWPAAIADGRAEATLAALLLAGRAQLIVAAYQTPDKARAMALIDAAEKDFDAALTKAPTDTEAQLQKALAIGYRAKLTRSPGLAKDARKRMEAVKAARPEMALAWAAIGGWHGNSIATVGSFIASTMLDAHLRSMEASFEHAIRLEPQNPVPRTYFAITLLDLGSGNLARAAAIIAPVAGLPARDGFEALLKRQAAQLSVAIKTGDRKAAQAVARKLLPFASVE